MGSKTNEHQTSSVQPFKEHIQTQESQGGYWWMCDAQTNMEWCVWRGGVEEVWIQANEQNGKI